MGEHGDNMVPIMSSTSIGGILLKYFKGYDDFDMDRTVEKVKNAGNYVIKRKVLQNMDRPLQYPTLPLSF